MAWIKTVPLSEASDELKRALEAQRGLYPEEYAMPAHPTDDGTAGIVASHKYRSIHHDGEHTAL